jgi:hypothetical protein
VTTPSEVSSHRCQIHSALSATECREALRDAGGSITVSQDLERHFQTFEIVYRQQNRLGLPVSGKRDSLMLQSYPPGEVR